MKFRFARFAAICLPAVAGFVITFAAAPLRSQENQSGPSGQERQRMAEEIEILRVIVNRTLHELAVPSSTGWSSWNYGALGGAGISTGTIDHDGIVGGLAMPGGSGTLNLTGGGGLAGGEPAGPGGGMGMPGMGSGGGPYIGFYNPYNPAQPAAEAEAVYLPGYGVVYTMTLASSSEVSLPQRMQPMPETIDFWQQVRNELLGTPQPADSSQKPNRTVTIWELVLRVLAENGRHLSQMSADERVTVSLTFRMPNPGSTGVIYGMSSPGGVDMGGGAPGAMGPGGASGQPGGGGILSPADAGGAGPGGGGGTAAPQDPRDYVLLGDLHLKQGKPQEAVNAYGEALKIQPQATHVHLKLAQAYLALGDAESAKKVLESAPAATGGGPPAAANSAENSTAAPAVPLAPKLVVSVSKRLLDQVAAGEISFEEFRNAATIEQLNSAQTAQPGGVGSAAIGDK